MTEIETEVEENAYELLTPVGRLSHPHLIEPRAYEEKGKAKGKPRFESNLILELEDVKAFRMQEEDGGPLVEQDFGALAMKMILTEWPELESVTDVKQAVKFGGLKWPLVAGEKKAKDPEDVNFVGKKVISAHTSTEYPPILYVMEGGKTRQLNHGVPADEAKMKLLFRGGNYADMEINVKPNLVDGKKFVTCYISSVRFIKTGASFGRSAGGGLMALAGAEGGEAAHDPTAGLDEEIDL